MLKDVRIQNYRLFEDLQVNDLGRVNLIVGENNAGKTSLIEALYLLFSENNKPAFIEISENRYKNYLFFSHKDFYGVDETDIVLNKKFWNCLLPPENKKNILISSNHHLRTLNIELLEENLKISYQINSENINFELNLNESINLKGSTPNVYFVTLLKLRYLTLKELWNKNKEGLTEKNVLEILKIIEPNIESIDFKAYPEIDDILIRLKNNPTLVSLHSFGNGLSHLLKIGVHFALARDGVLCIDEIDTGLHYRMMTKMWEAILQTAQQLNVQVFATTHSWDCIKAFSEALEKQKAGDSDLGRLIRLQQYEDGEIEAVNYTPKELSFNVFQEIEVR